MLEQLFFITVSVVLFGIIFFKMIKKNDTSYIILLAIEALGIIIDGAGIIFNLATNKMLKTFIYLIE